MRKPSTTLPKVEEFSGEPKLPRSTGRFQKTQAGGKMGSAGDDMAGDTQLKPKVPNVPKAGHVATPIPTEHIYGKRVAGGYKMHENPHDVGRRDMMNGDANGPKIKIPKVK